MAEAAGERDGPQTNITKDADAPTSAATLVSPPGSKTPPSERAKYKTLHVSLDPPKLRARPGSEPINPDALARALKGYEDTSRQRERTPGTSPSRKRQRVYGDRYVKPAYTLRR
jgi:cell division cycle 20-like protein 1 (cofactor of APC complex)